jgi:hypothetical protein
MKYKGHCQTAWSAALQLVKGNVCSETKELTTGKEFARFANPVYGERSWNIKTIAYLMKSYLAVSICSQVWGLVGVLETFLLRTAVFVGGGHFLPKVSHLRGEIWLLGSLGIEPKEHVIG